MTNGIVYTIQSGDTLTTIANGVNSCYGVTVDGIEQANPSVNPNNLQVGATLAIPAQKTPAPQPSSGGTSSQPLVRAQNIGYWDWTWAPTGTAPQGATLGLAFSGYADPTQALQSSQAVIDKLFGVKFLTLGGGNDAGKFTAAVLASIDQAITSGQFDAYQGLAFDIEEGDSGLEDAFATSFQLAYARGFQVLVTVSHSAPYGVSDAQALMTSLFSSPYIDFLSPQLYTTGEETTNDFTTTAGVTWQQYATAKAAVIPSIVQSSYYANAQTTFATYGVTTRGYVCWNQT